MPAASCTQVLAQQTGRCPGRAGGRGCRPTARRRGGRSIRAAPSSRPRRPRRNRPDAHCGGRTGSSGTAQAVTGRARGVLPRTRSSSNMAAIWRLVVPWIRVSAQRRSQRSRYAWPSSRCSNRRPNSRRNGKTARSTVRRLTSIDCSRSREADDEGFDRPPAEALECLRHVLRRFPCLRGLDTDIYPTPDAEVAIFGIRLSGTLPRTATVRRRWSGAVLRQRRRTAPPRAVRQGVGSRSCGTTSSWRRSLSSAHERPDRDRRDSGPRAPRLLRESGGACRAWRQDSAPRFPATWVVRLDEQVDARGGRPEVRPDQCRGCRRAKAAATSSTPRVARPAVLATSGFAVGVCRPRRPMTTRTTARFSWRWPRRRGRSSTAIPRTCRSGPTPLVVAPRLASRH